MKNFVGIFARHSIRNILLCIFTFVVVFAGSVLLLSCTKEGPVGPRGSPGTANVIYSDWIQFSLNWTLVTEFGKQYRLYPVEVPAIDSGIVDRGTVLVYWKTYGVPQPVPLPAVRYDPGTNRHTYLTYRFAIGTLTIVHSDLDDVYDPGITGNFFRYIIIPGSIPVSGKTTALNYQDYESVKNYFQIPE